MCRFLAIERRDRLDRGDIDTKILTALGLDGPISPNATLDLWFELWKVLSCTLNLFM